MPTRGGSLRERAVLRLDRTASRVCDRHDGERTVSRVRLHGHWGVHVAGVDTGRDLGGELVDRLTHVLFEDLADRGVVQVDHVPTALLTATSMPGAQPVYGLIHSAGSPSTA